ncbi:hypothetical protein ACFRJ9_15955 [Paenarthrobacter sp. NPDC056912]|uniref:hypothetical protein n=1 Tax=Paenarthrobacter sp. NPDC056912 TaxID=3345965 RepID=UPI0036721CD1
MPLTFRSADNSWEFQNQKHVVVYEALTARVGHRDGLLWQSPALALTAQAFLLTIALGHESTSFARLISALLGTAITVLSIQLMRKHRMYLWNEMIAMHALEREMGLSVSAVDYSNQLAYIYKNDPARHYIQPKTKRFLTKLESVRVWTYGLAVFGFVNLGLSVLSILSMSGVKTLDALL